MAFYEEVIMKICVSILKSFVFLHCFTSSGWSKSPSLNAPGTVFIRQKIADFKAFHEVFLDQKQNLKDHSFSAFSLHRDLNDPLTYILTLQCPNLEKGVNFVRSPEFMSAMDKAGGRIPMVWYGLDTTARKYSDQPKMTGGIVIARNEVRDYKFWLDCFYKEDGGKHNHPGRKYKNSNYSIHHLPGEPAVAIVAHEASDVSKAPVFMTSDPMNGEMEATGVVGLEIWYGINLEEGIF
jgi:hypothetical protein